MRLRAAISTHARTHAYAVTGQEITCCSRHRPHAPPAQNAQMQKACHVFRKNFQKITKISQPQMCQSKAQKVQLQRKGTTKMEVFRALNDQRWTKQKQRQRKRTKHRWRRVRRRQRFGQSN
ncbi:hypothetical protein niasHS_013396 [Heterodera schachtii]|uniref:Uncharacterized protein n=1 Tax=Heterodera schachtii TaxID=97005 RepID=A0ABD2IG61_HETSC